MLVNTSTVIYVMDLDCSIENRVHHDAECIV